MAKPLTIHERLDAQAETLHAILTQTTATNGRVTRIEADVYGDEPHQVEGMKPAVKKLTEEASDRHAVTRAVNRYGAAFLALGGSSLLIEVVRWITHK